MKENYEIISKRKQKAKQTLKYSFECEKVTKTAEVTINIFQSHIINNSSAPIMRVLIGLDTNKVYNVYTLCVINQQNV